MIRIWGDIYEIDAKGRIILSHAEDVKSEQVELKEGMHAIIWDAGFEAEGVLEFEDEEWRARIVPGTIREWHLNPRAAKKRQELDSVVRQGKRVDVDILFWDYYDFPRMFVTRWHGKLLFFECRFNEDRDDYDDYFSVYVLPPAWAEHLSDRHWPSITNLGSEGRLVGRIPVKEVTFPFWLEQLEYSKERITTIQERRTKAFLRGLVVDDIFKKLGLD
jgi:hypothetical protein